MTKTELKKRLETLSNPAIATLIDTWVRGELNRQILKYRIIDELSLEAVAEKVGLSVQQTKARLYPAQKKLAQHLPET